MSENILPVGTKVMIMSNNIPIHNGKIDYIKSVLKDGEEFRCRLTGITCSHDGIGYLLGGPYGVVGCSREGVFRRSSLLVIDDKTDGTTFSDMMSNLTERHRIDAETGN